jgi:hypothetical protein
MNKDDEKRIAAKLAQIMAMLCVRNTQLETLHAGPTPPSPGPATIRMSLFSTPMVDAFPGHRYHASMMPRCAI